PGLSLDGFDWSSLPATLRELVLWKCRPGSLAALKLPRLAELVLIEPTGPTSSLQLPALRTLRLVEDRHGFLGDLFGEGPPEILQQLDLLDVSCTETGSALRTIRRRGLEIAEAVGDAVLGGGEPEGQ